MTEILGYYSLSGALLVAIVAMMSAIASARFGSARPLRVARWSLGGVFGLLTIASGTLFVALAGDDFRFDYVARFTERNLPLGYKLAAFWAGQEGSLLLWAWFLGAMAVLVGIIQRKRADREAAVTTAVLAAACTFFAALMLYAANPFIRATQVVMDGNGLNPMLQDPGMIAHPPTLFMGYAGFTVPFAMMLGALITGRRDSGWLADTRRWTIFSWLLLTIGILLGAWWAYGQLGWGGYWGWDPVENASLLPWLTGTALLHSMMVQQKRGMLKGWNVSLIAATFILCIFGTFITRSGVIQSVHAFEKSSVGTFFLVFLAICVLVSVGVIVRRRGLLRPEHRIESMTGREAAFVAGNILLVGMTVVTLIGTTFPLLSSVVHKDGISVGPSFYNKAVLPLGMLLVALMAAGPLLSYGQDAWRTLRRKLLIPAILAVLAIVATLLAGITSLWSLAAAGVCAAGLSAIATDLFRSVRERAAAHGENVVLRVARLLDSNHRRYGGQIVHVGVLMVVIGAVGSSLYKQEQDLQLKPHESAAFAGGTLTLDGVGIQERPNHVAAVANLTFVDTGGRTRKLAPELRNYNKYSERSQTVVAVRSSWRGDVYIVLAGVEPDLSIAGFKAMVNPLVGWIWLGGIVMSLGGIVCLLPRLDPRTWRAGAQARAGQAVSESPARGRAKPARKAAARRTSRPAVGVS